MTDSNVLIQYFSCFFMKYRQLTKEQLLELPTEFAKFLATQQIDTSEWGKMKLENPVMAEEELNIFSDIVWEDVLTKTKYIEHISENHINLFKCNTSEIIRIYIKLNDSNKNFLDKNDFNWFANNFLDDSIEYFKAVKKYTDERNQEIFNLIEMGGQISEGKLFNTVSQLIA